MKRVVYIAFLAGLALFIILITYQGITRSIFAVVTAGWGILAVVLFHLIPMTADALGWYVLLDRSPRSRFHTILWARWIGESVNTLLPVAQVGGELVKARLLVHRQIPGAQAGASIVVNLTFAALTQAIFTLLGLGLLTFILDETRMAQEMFIGVIISILSILAFYQLQRRDLFGWLARRFKNFPGGAHWLALAGGADALDTSIIHLYKQRWRMLVSFSWMFFGWLLGTGEVWLALYFLGHPVNLIEALMVESLAQAAKGAAFLVPGAIGVLEGGYIILSGLIGLPASAGLALALIRRLRELSLGIPGLLIWQLMEGKRLWRRRASQIHP